MYNLVALCMKCVTEFEDITYFTEFAELLLCDVDHRKSFVGYKLLMMI